MAKLIIEVGHVEFTQESL